MNRNRPTMADVDRIWAVVPAAGAGRRFGAETPKQYQTLLDGRSILQASVEALLDGAPLLSVVVALAEDDPFWPAQAIANHEQIKACVGGQERADSVLSGLKTLQGLGALQEDWVLVHDAARPGLPREALQRLIQDCREKGQGGILALPVRDTLKRSNVSGQVEATVSREQLWQAQTPQMFRFGELFAALTAQQDAGTPPTDEAAAMEAAGHAVNLVMGDPRNFKITVVEDMLLPGLQD